MPTPNVGQKDAVIRFVVAVILLAVGHALIEEVSKTLGIALNLVAFVLIFSGYFRFCVLYRVFGISTVK